MKRIQKMAMYLLVSGAGIIYADQDLTLKVTNKSDFDITVYVANRNSNHDTPVYSFNNQTDRTKTQSTDKFGDIASKQQAMKITPNIVANIKYIQDPRGVTVGFFAADGTTISQTINLPLYERNSEIIVEGKADGSVVQSVALWNNTLLKASFPAGLTVDANNAVVNANSITTGTDSKTNMLVMYYADTNASYKAGR
jgi:hypothetical protein